MLTGIGINTPLKGELIEISPLYDENGWRIVRVAVDGVEAPEFLVHRNAIERHQTEESLFAYLFQYGKSLIEKLGSARNPLPAEAIEGGRL